MNTMLLVVGLLGFSALRDDTDPEPPKPGPLTVRLVAKKSTYKLDLQGGTVAEYKKAVEQGRAPFVSVDLEIVITNKTKSKVSVQTNGSRAKMTLTLKGKGTFQATFGARTAGTGRGSDFVVIRPGGKLSIPIEKLISHHGTKLTSVHAWTEPGVYTLTASLATVVEFDWGSKEGKGKLTEITLTPYPVSLKVEK